jgi:hypothetical protein
MVDISCAELGETRTQWRSKYGYVYYTMVQSTVTNCCTSRIICAKSASGTTEIIIISQSFILQQPTEKEFGHKCMQR